MDTMDGIPIAEVLIKEEPVEENDNISSDSEKEELNYSEDNEEKLESGIKSDLQKCTAILELSESDPLNETREIQEAAEETFRSRNKHLNSENNAKFAVDLTSAAKKKFPNLSLSFLQLELNKRVKKPHIDDAPTLKGKTHFCSVCGRGFTGPKTLSNHIVSHTYPPKIYNCPHCDKTFSHIRNYKSHLVLHTGSKSHICVICGKSFLRSGALNRHLEIHTGQKNYSCTVCGKAFRRDSNLKAHFLTHSNIKNHSCGLCGKSFAHSSTLKNHIVSHTGERNYLCGTCGKSFTRIGSLKEHMMIHSGVRNYKCERCGKTFIHPNSYKRHLITHSGMKKYKCEICDARFVHHCSYKRHIVKHTKGSKKIFKAQPSLINNTLYVNKIVNHSSLHRLLLNGDKLNIVGRKHPQWIEDNMFSKNDDYDDVEDEIEDEEDDTDCDEDLKAGVSDVSVTETENGCHDNSSKTVKSEIKSEATEKRVDNDENDDFVNKCNVSREGSPILKNDLEEAVKMSLNRGKLDCDFYENEVSDDSPLNLVVSEQNDLKYSDDCDSLEKCKIQEPIHLKSEKFGLNELSGNAISNR